MPVPLKKRSAGRPNAKKSKAAALLAGGGAQAVPAEAPGRDAIAARAFELYMQDGAVDGHDLEHWMKAERELVGSRQA